MKYKFQINIQGRKVVARKKIKSAIRLKGRNRKQHEIKKHIIICHFLITTY